MMSVRKSPNMMSTTGRIPVIAAPRPRPAMPASEMGESTTRSAPNSSTRPERTLNGWPASATSSPMRNTVGSRRSSSDSASLTACEIVSSRIPPRTALGKDIFGHLARFGVRRGERVRNGIGDLCLDSLAKLGDRRVVADPTSKKVDRIALGHPALLLFLLSVVRTVDVTDVMPVVAVRRRKKKRRAASGPPALDSLFCSRSNCQHVLPVDLRGRNAERLSACRDRPGRDFGEVCVFVVEVVLAHVDDRQLPERGHVHDLVQQPLAERAVAEETHGDAISAQTLRSKRGAGRDSC